MILNASSGGSINHPFGGAGHWISFGSRLRSFTSFRLSNLERRKTRSEAQRPHRQIVPAALFGTAEARVDANQDP